MAIERSGTAIEDPREAEFEASFQRSNVPNWVCNCQILWRHRRFLTWATGTALAVNLVVSLLIPRTYISEAQIMPPESAGSNSALIAALAGRSLEGELLGGLAASLMGGHNSGALFIALLRSGSVTGKLIDRFHLQRVYGKRYRIDAAKTLARRTTITQDKKSGVITLQVKDHDARRARDMAQAYLDELNAVVNRTSTSSAHQERVFIERRLNAVKADLERAQEALSEFSSTHATIDLREQTRATVESEAKVQGELIAARGEMESLQQVYGDSNVRVRAAAARVGALKRELSRMGGSAAPLAASAERNATGGVSADLGPVESYLPLRQVPRLAVPYANLYRDVHVQETVYDLLTQQYEVARIQEAKDIPAVNVIDAPGIAEKKSFPPRALLTLALTGAMFVAFSMFLIGREHWRETPTDDPRRVFAAEVFQVAWGVVQRSTGIVRRSA